jgi:hypothetical protein
MKTTRNVLFALLLLGVSAGTASAQLSVGAGVQVGPRGHASVDLGFFYDSLASYGNWIERPSYGWVWTPRDVSASWRPYQAGHWVWSDEGWTWLTDEPYGWATYHYGRWYQDPEIGWAWVPGSDWAPAWVSWQEGNDYVGWAPLPPGANLNASNTGGPGPGYDNGPNGPGYDDQGPVYDNGDGYDNGPAYDDNGRYDSGPVYDNGYAYDNGYSYDGGYGYANYAYGIAPSAYLFVPTRAFLSVDLFDFFVPWVRVSSFFRLTHNCTSYGFDGGHYFNRGIAFEHVRRYYHDVPRYRLAGLDGFRGRGYQVDGNRVSFFRPQVSRGWRGSPMDRAGARRSVTTVNQFRNEHPDRQRSFAQTNGQRFQRDNRQGFSSRQAQGDRSGQGWQRDQATRQRSFENGRGQADRQQFNAQRQQQYNAERQQQLNRQQWQQNNAQRQRQQQQNNAQRWQQNNNAQRQQGQQDQTTRQRSFDNRAQPQAGWQRQYNVQPQQRQQQYQPRQQYQPQRQAPPQQQYRSDAGRGQGNRGQATRDQGNRGQNNRGHGNDRRQHGG